MTRYGLSIDARSDLRGIRIYLAPAPKAIQSRILNQLEATFRLLCDFPLSGRVEPELTARYSEHTRSALLHPYRIFYFPELFPLTIFAILHGAQDIAAILRARNVQP